jgi:hypothetical protein
VLAGAVLERHYLVASRLSVVVFGLVLGALAHFFSALDLSRRRVADWANVPAMVLMAFANLVLLVSSDRQILEFVWSWLAILGTVGTMALALAFSAAAAGLGRRDWGPFHGRPRTVFY